MDIDYEEQLILAKKGNIQAFERLILHYERLIYNISFRMLGNPDDAKDAAQETLIKIYKNINDCKDLSSFKSWLYKVTNNTCIDLIRKRKGKMTLSTDALIESEKGSFLKENASPAQTPEAVLLQKERIGKIQSAICELTPEHRSLIILRDIKGLTYEEICDITDSQMGTVKSRLSRARIKLRGILSKHMEQNEL